MIALSVSLGEKQYAVKMKGHSGFARRGEDIVCAGASALSCSLFSYISELEKRGEVNVALKELGSGKMTLSFTYQNDKAEAAVEMFLKGMKSLSKVYPRYVSVCEKNKES